jgi:hypothetical protein
MEEAFYTLERQLLQPVYALYPWSPDRKAADTGRLEQALFAATVRSDAKNTATGLHSLTAASLPDKEHEIERERTTANGVAKLCWVMLVLAGLGMGYAALWCFVRLRTLLILHGAALLLVVAGTGFLFGLAWLSLGSSAAKSRKGMAMQDRAVGSARWETP